jgi:hypothetical protein
MAELRVNVAAVLAVAADVVLVAQQLLKLGVHLVNFPVRDTRALATGISCFPCQTATWSFLRFSATPRPFYPACSPPPGCFFPRD